MFLRSQKAGGHQSAAILSSFQKSGPTNALTLTHMAHGPHGPAGFLARSMKHPARHPPAQCCVCGAPSHLVFAFAVYSVCPCPGLWAVFGQRVLRAAASCLCLPVCSLGCELRAPCELLNSACARGGNLDFDRRRACFAVLGELEFSQAFLQIVHIPAQSDLKPAPRVAVSITCRWLALVYVY